MIDLKKPFTFDRVVRITITLTILFGLILLARYLSDVLIPFVVAVIFAYLINPLVKFVQKYIHKRSYAVVVSFLVIFIVVVAASWLIIPAIYREFRHFGHFITVLITDANLSGKLAQILPSETWKNIQELIKRENIQAVFSSESLFNLAGKLGEKILPGVWGIISGTATIISALVGTIIIVMYLVFILIDYDKIKNSWKEMLPDNYKNMVENFIEDFLEAMNKYFRNQALIAMIMGILFAISFSIIDMPMAIVLGFFIGLLNMVPYLQIIGTIPAIILAFLHAMETGQNPWIFIGIVVIIFMIMQFIQDWILTPKIMGKVTGLNPAFIILSITIWGKLLGFLGLIIALPLTFLLISYYKKIMAYTNQPLHPLVLPKNKEDKETKRTKNT